MNLPKKVELIEVCPRDGFQNVHDIIPFDAKVAIIKKLAEAGFKRVEAVSFVSPKAIPQMADAKDVMLAVKDTLKEHGVRSVAHPRSCRTPMAPGSVRTRVAGSSDSKYALTGSPFFPCQRNVG